MTIHQRLEDFAVEDLAKRFADRSNQQVLGLHGEPTARQASATVGNSCATMRD